MLRTLGLIFAAVAFFTIAGGHWAVLQSVAWAEMLRAYSQKSGCIAVAVEQTFDGQHPCELCREIQTAQSNEHKESPAAPGAKEDAKVKALVVELVSGVFVRTTEEVLLSRALSDVGHSRTEPPPTPPPRQGVRAA